jgi:hypothetical protein
MASQSRRVFVVLLTKLFRCYRVYFLTIGHVCWDQYCIPFCILGVKMWVCHTFWKVNCQVWKDSSYFIVWTVLLTCEFALLLPYVSVVNKFHQTGCSSNVVKLYFRNMQFYLGQVVWSDSASVWFSSSQTHFLLLIVVFSLHRWWRLRQYVPLKHCLSPIVFCSVITQETIWTGVMVF